MDILYVLPIAFFAGLVDAIAGGGGLIQIPGMLLLFPTLPIVTILGTNKLASSCGTMMSSLHYTRTLHINFKAIAPTLLASFLFSLLGAKVATIVDNSILHPIILVLLILIGLYAFFKKDLGLIIKEEHIIGAKLHVYCVVIGMIMGFYDGFFGPGTGSILIFCFVGWLGFSFLQGSAFSKLTNLASNLAATLVFAGGHHILYKIALPMAVCNILGNLVGAKLAIKKGSSFVRWIFLLVIVGIIGQFIYKMAAVPGEQPRWGVVRGENRDSSP